MCVLSDKPQTQKALAVFMMLHDCVCKKQSKEQTKESCFMITNQLKNVDYLFQRITHLYVYCC